jgi:hypothetical protein
MIETKNNFKGFGESRTNTKTKNTNKLSRLD